MFNTHTHGEGFGLHLQSLGMHQLKHVSGAVARGQNDRLPPDLMVISIVQGHRFHPRTRTLRFEQIHHLGVEPHLTTCAFDGFPHRGHHGRQTVGADVRMGFHQDVGIRPMHHHPFKGFADVASFFASGVQFSVAVGACAPLAEAVVRFGIDLVFSVELGQITSPRTHVLPTLQHDGAHPVPQAFQCGVQACRTGAHDDHFFGIGFDVGPCPGLDLGLARAFIPSHQKLHANRPLSGIPALSQDMQFLFRSNCRTPLLAKLSLHSLSHHLGLRHFLGQHPNLDL